MNRHTIVDITGYALVRPSRRTSLRALAAMSVGAIVAAPRAAAANKRAGKKAKKKCKKQVPQCEAAFARLCGSDATCYANSVPCCQSLATCKAEVFIICAAGGPV
jgi:hypothetical protein